MNNFKCNDTYPRVKFIQNQYLNKENKQLIFIIDNYAYLMYVTRLYLKDAKKFETIIVLLVSRGYRIKYYRTCKVFKISND